MPKNINPKSKWYDQYAKEYRRITQAISRQEKLGYTVPDNVRPIKPSEMQNIRKSDVQKLINLTPQKIRKSSWYTEPDGMGETYFGLDVVKSHHKAKPSEAKSKQAKPKKKCKPKKPLPPPPEPEELDTFWYGDDIDNVPEQHHQYYPGFTNIAITGFFNQLKQFPSAEGAKLISKWFSDIIDKYGRDAAAQMLDEGSRYGLIIDGALVYNKDSSRVWNYMTQMMDFLPDVDENDKKKMGEIMESIEGWESPL